MAQMQKNWSVLGVMVSLLSRICFSTALIVPLLVRHANAVIPLASDIQTPQIGDHGLRILTPTVLELSLVNTADSNSGMVDSWNWVDDQQNFVQPDTSSIRVVINGQTNFPTVRIWNAVLKVHAPLLYWDLRIGNDLYLKLSNAVPVGASVQVINNGTLWATNLSFCGGR